MFSYGYPRSYNPYGAAPMGRRPSESSYLDQALLQERARAIEEQRARRAQWLPDEVDNSDDEFEYAQLGPRERAYLEALKKQQLLERLRKEQEAEALARQEEAARQRELEEKAWQEALERRHKEAEQAKQKILEQRRREMQQRREEALRHLSALERERELRAQHQQRQRQAERAAPNHFGRTPSPQRPTPHPQSSSKPTTIPVTEPKAAKRAYTEEETNAAARLQQQYRIHRSYRILDNISSQFKSLKDNFVYPSKIDFQQPGSDDGHITVRANRPPSDFNDVVDKDEATTMDVDGQEGKLAYTSTNFPVHTYNDAVDKLLMKLDEVESWGERGIREKRKSIAKEIGKESARLERYWKQAWLDHLKREKEEETERLLAQSMQEDMQTQIPLDLDEEPIHVELHPHEIKADDEWVDLDDASEPEPKQESEAGEVDDAMIEEPVQVQQVEEDATVQVDEPVQVSGSSPSES